MVAAISCTAPACCISSSGLTGCNCSPRRMSAVGSDGEELMSATSSAAMDDVRRVPPGSPVFYAVQSLPVVSHGDTPSGQNCEVRSPAYRLSFVIFTIISHSFLC